MPLIPGFCTISEPETDPVTHQQVTPPIVAGTGLAKAIADACAAPNPPGSTTSSSLQQFCNRLAAAIVEHFVANGLVTVNVAAGIPVATTGTAAAQAGATTGPGAGTGTLS